MQPIVKYSKFVIWAILMYVMSLVARLTAKVARCSRRTFRTLMGKSIDAWNDFYRILPKDYQEHLHEMNDIMND